MAGMYNCLRYVGLYKIWLETFDEDNKPEAAIFQEKLHLRKALNLAAMLSLELKQP